MIQYLHVRVSLAQPLDPLVQWKLMNVVMRAKFDAHQQNLFIIK